MAQLDELQYFSARNATFSRSKIREASEGLQLWRTGKGPDEIAHALFLFLNQYPQSR
jgi:hypothetical protein